MKFLNFTNPAARALILGAGAISLALLFGCERAERADQRDRSEEETAEVGGDEQATPRLVTSDELPERPARIVSLAPNVTEILFALGAGDRIAGVTRFCDYPPEADELPSVGGMVEVDLEAILSRRPDLVVGMTSGGDSDLVRKLKGADTPHAFLRMDDLEETYWGIKKIGELVGERERADTLVEQMRGDIERLAQAGAEDRSPAILLLYGRDPLIAAGPGTFGDQLVELAGGRNAVGGLETGYPKLDVEAVIDLDPDRIVDASSAADSPRDDFWGDYRALQAVEAGHLYRMREAVLLRPTPRLVDGLKLMRRVVEGDTLEAQSEATGEDAQK